MELYDAATYFDDIEAFDAYSHQLLFLCQFSNFDDRSADGTTSKRRVLSVAPETLIPSRRVLTLLDENWIVGDGNSDAIYNTKIRRAYSMKKANYLAEILTPGMAVNQVPGNFAYAQAVYFKDTFDQLQTSDYDAFYNIFFSVTEPVKQTNIIRLDDRFYRVRGTYKPLEGYVTAQSDELSEDAIQTVMFNSGSTYDPVSDTYIATPTSTRCLRIDFTKAIENLQHSSPVEKRGDEKAYFSKTDLPSLKVGETFQMQGEEWRVVSAVTSGDAWLAHIRRG